MELLDELSASTSSLAIESGRGPDLLEQRKATGEMMRSIKSTLAPLHVVQNFSKFANGLAGTHLIACLALAGGALAIQAAYAADPEDEVKEIVVTGSRLSSANST